MARVVRKSWWQQCCSCCSRGEEVDDYVRGPGGPAGRPSDRTTNGDYNTEGDRIQGGDRIPGDERISGGDRTTGGFDENGVRINHSTEPGIPGSENGDRTPMPTGKNIYTPNYKKKKHFKFSSTLISLVLAPLLLLYFNVIHLPLYVLGFVNTLRFT